MITIDKRYFRYFDWINFIIMLALATIGLLFVFSTTYQTHMPYSIFFKKQCFGLLSGIIIYFIFCLLDYRILCAIGYLLYYLVIGLLLLTIIKGSIGLGARRWIHLFFFKFQPSELTKLFFPAFFTYYFYTYAKSNKQATLQWMFFIVCFSSFLILKQPDLGTATLVFLSGTLLCWFAGIKKSFLYILFFASLLAIPLFWRVLKPYQKQRITTFLGYGNKNKERYQIEQSTIAIGSGGIAGKGFLQGTQNILQFLPESRTDFIFSVICEEWGLLGALLILSLFTLFFLRSLSIINTMNTLFAQLLSLGLLLPHILSCIINIGMVIGLLPTVGIPLPLISYGITHMWVSFASLGWLQGIFVRRFYIGK